MTRTDAPAPAPRLADGQWHRLHPATPLLRGGFALVAVIGIVISQLRERLINFVLGERMPDQGDPIAMLVNGGFVPLALGIIVLILALFVAGFYLSWRVHEFRITDELVEVRSGLIIRSNRKGRLDRIQGINIVRPLFARIFGAARLEIDVAGHDANVRLDYLSSQKADALRRDILRLASGTRVREAEHAAPAEVGLLEQRVNELLAPELDPSIAPPESIVKIHLGRLLGSIVLHDTTVAFIVVFAAGAWGGAATGEPATLLIVIPFLFALGGFIVRRFTKSLQYSIASTPDGVRVGFGLLTLSNETLPPGRIHSVQIRQPLLWRLPGWWEIQVNRASKSNAKGADGQRNTTILPVGNRDDVLRVIALLQPQLADSVSLELVGRGMVSRGDDGVTTSPRRAVLVCWFSWRRNGFAFTDGTVLLRKGAIWRSLTIVPEARVQSIGLLQGPLYRMLRLAHLDIHTVHGPIRADLGAVDRDTALAFFEKVSLDVVRAIALDSSHRWREDEVAG